MYWNGKALAFHPSNPLVGGPPQQQVIPFELAGVKSGNLPPAPAAGKKKIRVTIGYQQSAAR
jgi:hypothetical protein